MAGHYFPTIAKLGQKIKYLKYNCNNVANILGGIILQFAKIGIK
jgi:hypothetical protein